MLAITMQLKPMLMHAARHTCCRIQSCNFQGISILRAVVGLGANIFDDGQAYEALSRLRSREGLAIGHDSDSCCNE
jgi:hypothetical protein